MMRRAFLPSMHYMSHHSHMQCRAACWKRVFCTIKHPYIVTWQLQQLVFWWGGEHALRTLPPSCRVSIWSASHCQWRVGMDQAGLRQKGFTSNGRGLCFVSLSNAVLLLVCRHS
jgi:hypothetical protein